MKIKIIVAGAAIAGLAACAVTGMAIAQMAAPAAPTQAAAPASPHPHRDFRPGMMPHPPAFEDLDTNHDGVVSKAEFEAWRAAHPMPGRPPAGGDVAGGMGEPMGGWPGSGRHHMHERFGPPVDLETADSDHDGRISWAEFQAAATARLKAHFDRLDVNHDGFIDKSELPGRGMRHDQDDQDSGADASSPSK